MRRLQVALERAVCERRLQQLAALEAEVARVDSHADLAAFIATERERTRSADSSRGGGDGGAPPVRYVRQMLELLDGCHQP